MSDKVKTFFKSSQFYLIEYILSKIAQFLVYSAFIVGTLAFIKYLVVNKHVVSSRFANKDY